MQQTSVTLCEQCRLDAGHFSLYPSEQQSSAMYGTRCRLGLDQIWSIHDNAILTRIFLKSIFCLISIRWFDHSLIYSFFSLSSPNFEMTCECHIVCHLLYWGGGGGGG